MSENSSYANTTQTAELITIDGAELLVRKLYYIDCYLSCFNKRQAALLAGFTGNPTTVYDRILADEICKKYLQDSLKDMALSKEIVLARLGDIARGAYAQYITKTGDVDLISLVRDNQQHLIKKITWSSFGPTVEFYDSMTALGILAKHYGLLDGAPADKDIRLVVTYAEEPEKGASAKDAV